VTFELEISEFELRRVLLVQEADVDFFLYRKGAGESIVLDSSGVLFLLERGLHNFSDQEPGYGNAIVKSGFLIDAKGAEMHSSVEIFQKTIGDRPKILKVQGLEETFEDGDLVLACWSPKRITIPSSWPLRDGRGSRSRSSSCGVVPEWGETAPENPDW
jgi:hypothetical protein